jgi:hypothetical protein
MQYYAMTLCTVMRPTLNRSATSSQTPALNQLPGVVDLLAGELPLFPCLTRSARAALIPL